jgi:hypothetical protein
MPSWITITEADLLTRLSSAELSALRAAALGVGQADPVAGIIGDVVQEIRGYCSSAGYALDALVTIPKRLKSAALDRIVWEIMKRPGATIIDSDGARKDANAAAIALFVRVARGEFLLDDNVTGSTSPGDAAWASETKIDL